ncbi:GATA transcription factor 11-like [Cicer arietinum]|uniref:GATA transcription factor 11-like n=1 Tax=Cicer arietinum TaxID=3827 RepID=UPI00032A64E8
MKTNWFFDQNFNGVSEDILEDVIEFFDFRLDDVELTDVVEEDWNAQFKHLEEPSLGVFSVPSSGLCGEIETQNEKPKLGKSFSAAELSHIDGRNIVNSSLKDRQVLLAKTAGPAYGKTIPIQNVSFNGKDLRRCQTYSPVSVFESSSYSSVDNFNFELPVIPAKRPRSKCRRRLSTFDKLFSIPFISTPPAFRKRQRLAASESVCRVQRKQRKTDSIRMKSQESVAPRKCMHCEVTETPQWREGPKGPKTLCNACGVRYRSGRLFPEYRPAASPTFEASSHSNSHKKVLEMRNKASQETFKGSSMLYLSSNLPGSSV